MSSSVSKSSLSPARTRLLELFQSLNFGRLEALKIYDGQPVFDPPPRVVQIVKVGAENGPRRERSYTEFFLKHEIVEVFDLISSVGQGEIERIDVQFGLPQRLEIERSVGYLEGHSAVAVTGNRGMEYCAARGCGDKAPEIYRGEK